MSREEEVTVLNLWQTWQVGKPLENDTYKDFFFEVVRSDYALYQLNVFEVLDSLVNSSVGDR